MIFKIKVEQDRVSFETDSPAIDLRTDHARLIADSLSMAADHADMEVPYEHEIKVIYKRDDVEEEVKEDGIPT